MSHQSQQRRSKGLTLAPIAVAAGVFNEPRLGNRAVPTLIIHNAGFLDLQCLETLRAMPDRSEYQPLAQDVDDNEADLGDSLPTPVTAAAPSRQLRRAQRPGHIDLSKLDNAFKR